MEYQWIKEGGYARKWLRLPCGDFTDFQVRLQWSPFGVQSGDLPLVLALPRTEPDGTPLPPETTT